MSDAGGSSSAVYVCMSRSVVVASVVVYNLDVSAYSDDPLGESRFRSPAATCAAEHAKPRGSCRSSVRLKTRPAMRLKPFNDARVNGSDLPAGDCLAETRSACNGQHTSRQFDHRS